MKSPLTYFTATFVDVATKKLPKAIPVTFYCSYLTLIDFLQMHFSFLVLFTHFLMFHSNVS